MYRVEVRNACRCFFRSGMAERQQFERREEAEAEAHRMLQEMEAHFCRQHRFDLSEFPGGYTIVIVPR